MNAMGSLANKYSVMKTASGRGFLFLLFFPVYPFFPDTKSRHEKHERHEAVIAAFFA